MAPLPICDETPSRKRPCSREHKNNNRQKSWIPAVWSREPIADRSTVSLVTVPAERTTAWSAAAVNRKSPLPSVTNRLIPAGV